MRVPGLTIRPPPKPMPFATGMIVAPTIAAPMITTVLIAGHFADVRDGRSRGSAVRDVAAAAQPARARRRRARQAGPRAHGRGRPGVASLFNSSLLSGLVFHRRPHGRYYRYGPVSLVHGIHAGGPCRNYVLGTRFEMRNNGYLIVA